MPQEPKKRHSRQRQGKRRASIHLNIAKTVSCPNCASQILSHQICKTCGYYKGREIIVKKEKTNQEEKTEKAHH